MSQRTMLHKSAQTTKPSSGRHAPFTAVLVLTALVLVGCGSANASSAKSRSGVTIAATGSEDASSPADEICERMTRDNVANQLTVGRLDGAPVRTKTGSITRCTYRISGGSLVMTVDERGGVASALQSFATSKLAATAPVKVPLLGTEAYTAKDGTTVTVKDDKVLTVDPTGLPAGNDRTQIAQSLSFEILTCWTH